MKDSIQSHDRLTLGFARRNGARCRRWAGSEYHGLGNCKVGESKPFARAWKRSDTVPELFGIPNAPNFSNPSRAAL